MIVYQLSNTLSSVYDKILHTKCKIPFTQLQDDNGKIICAYQTLFQTVWIETEQIDGNIFNFKLQVSQTINKSIKDIIIENRYLRNRCIDFASPSKPQIICLKDKIFLGVLDQRLRLYSVNSDKLQPLCNVKCELFRLFQDQYYDDRAYLAIIDKQIMRIIQIPTLKQIYKGKPFNKFTLNKSIQFTMVNNFTICFEQQQHLNVFVLNSNTFKRLEINQPLNIQEIVIQFLPRLDFCVLKDQLQNQSFQVLPYDREICDFTQIYLPFDKFDMKQIRMMEETQIKEMFLMDLVNVFSNIHQYQAELKNNDQESLITLMTQNLNRIEPYTLLSAILIGLKQDHNIYRLIMDYFLLLATILTNMSWFHNIQQQILDFLPVRPRIHDFESLQE